MSELSTPHVIIIGGGLAGLSAAQALADAVAFANGRKVIGGNSVQLKITLLEAKRSTGGRAGSFSDFVSGESIDYCQHVAMGCCTNFIAMLKRFDLLGDWKRYRELVFHRPGVKPSPFSPSRWLPAPLHLASCIGKLDYLTRNQKREVRLGMWRLMRTKSDSLADVTAKTWLQSVGQSQATIKAFWDVILISALGEETEVVSMQAARKVLIDGFAAAHGASDVLVPRNPLSEMFGERLPQKLKSLGVDLRCQSTVKRIDIASSAGPTVELANGEKLMADQVVSAVPWYRLSSMFDPDDAKAAIPNIQDCTRLDASPISGIHLWFDRPIMTKDHAVMVGTTAQWVFRQPLANSQPSNAQFQDGPDSKSGHYHQVVISASEQSQSLGKDALLKTVLDELRAEFPLGRDFKLLRHRIVTDPHSVFSVSPATERIRGCVRPALPWLHLAGDWTPTGWPSTMESAVISGRMAARSVAAKLNPSKSHAWGEIRIDSGLPWGSLAKLMIRR